MVTNEIDTMLSLSLSLSLSLIYRGCRVDFNGIAGCQGPQGPDCISLIQGALSLTLSYLHHPQAIFTRSNLSISLSLSLTHLPRSISSNPRFTAIIVTVYLSVISFEPPLASLRALSHSRTCTYARNG